jgi:hypothetical protein
MTRQRHTEEQIIAVLKDPQASIDLLPAGYDLYFHAAMGSKDSRT